MTRSRCSCVPLVAVAAGTATSGHASGEAADTGVASSTRRHFCAAAVVVVAVEARAGSSVGLRSRLLEKRSVAARVDLDHIWQRARGRGW